MRRARRRWLVAGAAVAALLAALAAIAVVTGAGLLDGAVQDESTTGEESGAAGLPDGVTLPALGLDKAADESQETRADGGEAGAGSAGGWEQTAVVVSDDGRRLVRTAELGLVLEGHDVTAAADRVVIITETLGGYVLSSSTGTSGYPGVAYPEDDVLGGDETRVAARDDISSATVTVRVPSRSFEAALRRFSRLGVVEYEHTWAEDVSDQMVDLEARLRHARAVERRLLRFLDATDTIKEMLAVQDRLDQVQLQIEQLTAQIEALREVVAFGTVTVSLRAEGDPTPVIGAGGGIWDNFVDAWRVLGRSAAVLLMAAAAALPFVIVGGAIAGAAWYGARRLARRREHRAGAEGAA